MYRGLLFMIGIVTGFNIQHSPVKHFTNDDPLFGQNAIQSTDGIFVPSPTNGKCFNCTLENECTEVNFDDEKPKGLRPVASVSSLTAKEEQLVVMCNQICIKKSVNEDLNGDCKLMVNPTGKVELNHAELVNNNNNNNHYQGRWIGQDAGTEIAFVLDGSGSIQPDDFQRAKDFIYNVMSNVWNTCFDASIYLKRTRLIIDYEKMLVHLYPMDHENYCAFLLRHKKLFQTKPPQNQIAFVLDGSGSIEHDDFQRAKDFIYKAMFSVWKTCFNCDFAIVQYGAEIRAELSLLDSKNHARAFQKIKEIQQIFNIRKTASAIHHVLTDIFIPENGSKNNSKKIIIVLSDGQMFRDPMSLSDVLNMPQMKGATRHSIGVGEGILSNPEAIQEMREIADPDRFFNVSNYAALEEIIFLMDLSGKKV
uniref:Integrin, alpha E, tandem duplicate 1 n=1 Tax=Sinocyclocheilus grahami TaxID=75366 RepID=A0A672RTG8_SINGR